MKAAMFYGPQDVKVIEIEEPVMGDNEVLVEVKACGICGTDQLIFNGFYAAAFPVILGHEYSGVIREMGKDVKGFKVGDTVGIDPNILCGKCFFCKSGKGNLCKEYTALGVTLNGGFAELSSVPVSNVYKLGSAVNFLEGAMLEPLACCIRGVEMGNVELGDVVVIFGSGPIGNLILQLVRLSGATKVIVIEPLKNRRKTALDTGADYVFNPESDNIEKEIKKIEEEGADIVFECSGNQSVQETAPYVARRGGTIIYFGCSPEDRLNKISPFIIGENELTVRGSFNNPYTTEKAARLLSSGMIKAGHLISHKIPLSGIREAFGIFGKEGVNKIIITP